MQSHAAMRKLMGFDPEVDPRLSLVQPASLEPGSVLLDALQPKRPGVYVLARARGPSARLQIYARVQRACMCPLTHQSPHLMHESST